MERRRQEERDGGRERQTERAGEMEREQREILVPDSYTGHGLETFLAGGQGGGAGPEVDQVLPLQRAHLLDHAPQPPLERHQPEA